MCYGENIETYKGRLENPNWNNIIVRLQCPCGARGISKEVEYNDSEQTSIISYNFDCPKCKRDYAFELEPFYNKSSNQLESRCYLVSTKTKCRRKRLHFKPVLVPYLNKYC